MEGLTGLVIAQMSLRDAARPGDSNEGGMLVTALCEWP